MGKYRLLILRRSPVASRPPSSFRLVWRGHWYDVWERTRPSALSRLALGRGLHPGQTPSCTALKRFARLHPGVELAAAPTQEAVVARLAQRLLPTGWKAVKRFPGAALPSGSGSVETVVRLPHGDRWQVWIGGGAAGKLTLTVDGRTVAVLRHRLNRHGQYEPAATARLAEGGHRVAIRYEDGLVAGRSEGLTLGPLALTPVGPPAKPLYLPARRVRSLCGRRLDWVEAVRR